MSSNRFHQYTKLSYELTPEKLAEIRRELIEDSKKPNAEREINLTEGLEYKITPLQFAIQRSGSGSCPKHQALIALYLEFSDFTIEGKYGSALHYAAMYPACGPEVVKTIATRNPELMKKPKDQLLPLHQAAASDTTGKCVAALIEAKADVAARTRDDHWTALHHASFANNMKSAKVLLEHKANKAAMNRHGETPTTISHYWRGNLHESVFFYLSKTKASELKKEHEAKKVMEGKNHEEVVAFIKRF